MSNKYTESLKVKNPPVIRNRKLIENDQKAEYANNTRSVHDLIMENPLAKEYIGNVVASIMMSHYSIYGDNTSVNMTYRIKSKNSLDKKILKKQNKGESEFNTNGQVEQTFPIINDIVACKLILRNAPPLYYSNNKELQQKIDRREKGKNLIKEMQKVKSQLVKDEFTSEENYEYNFDYPKLDFYKNCKNLVEGLINITDPNATKVILEYQKKLKDIEQKISEIQVEEKFSKTLNNEKDFQLKVDKSDFSNPDINFFDLLKEYSSSLDDERDLAILTTQFQSLFKNNPILDALGVSIDNRELKEKRTENGYSSNFIILNTLIGKIEVQLQTQHQYREGLTGRSAHSKMGGKEVTPIPIPKLNAPQEEHEIFYNNLRNTLATYYHAEVDDRYNRRVTIENYNLLQAYIALFSEMPKDVATSKTVRAYIDELYKYANSGKNKKFTMNNSMQGYMSSDIKDYIDSDNFKKFKELSQKNHLKSENGANEKYISDEQGSDYPILRSDYSVLNKDDQR